MAAAKKSATGLDKNTAGALSYVLGPITGVIFLVLEKDSYVRFHAMQSIVVFVTLFVLQFVMSATIILLPLVPLSDSYPSPSKTRINMLVFSIKSSFASFPKLCLSAFFLMIAIFFYVPCNLVLAYITNTIHIALFGTLTTKVINEGLTLDLNLLILIILSLTSIH